MSSMMNKGIKWMLTEALAIMDEKGKRDAMGTSRMLWDKDWQTLRQRIYCAFELAEQEDVIDD